MIERTEQEIMINWKGNIDTPLVSICTITYNHEKYIAEALDSFLMQETDFPFEMIIDDDCSTDGSVEVLKKYMEKFPNIIKANLREKNVGMLPNFVANVKRAKGKYIALCEGDDYWTDPLKLQKQVDFLESNFEYSLCYTAATLIDDNGVVLQENKSFGDSSKDELISSTGTAITGSAMFRRFNFDDFSKHDIINGDDLLWHYIGFYGKCKQLKNIKNTVYRIHGNGIWSGRSERSRLDEEIKTFSVIRNNIISKFGKNTYLLKKHDSTYNNIFAKYFSKNILSFNIQGLHHGLQKVKELKHVNKYAIYLVMLKHISLNIYRALRLNKVKRVLKGKR